ncbi:MAG: hypothetical protein JNM56_05605 [Planctomycetia bacterium]|nr:hypothetical protein [Planctomycetia bacterium]
MDEWLGLDAEWVGFSAHYGTLTATDLPSAFQEVRKLVAPPALPKPERKRLEQQIEQLRKRLDKARSNVVELDKSNIPAAEERIRQLDHQRVELEQELELYKPQAENDINAVALMVLNNLYALANCCRIMAKPEVFDDKGNRGVDHGDGTVTFGSLESAAPRAVRWLLSRASYIICHTEFAGSGNGRRHVFKGGEIVYNVAGLAKREVGLAKGRQNPHHAG